MTSVFITLIILTFSLRYWLTYRQIQHVKLHAAQVPERFKALISQEAHEKAAEYTVDRASFSQQSLFIELAILIALTLGGGLDWLDQMLRPHFSGIQLGMALIFSLMALSWLIDLPLAWYRQFVIEARHGFNRMTARLFFSDLLKQALLGLFIGAPILYVVLWLMGAMGNIWWLYVWAFWTSINLLLMLIYPTWIAPLFNKFSPLEDGETRGRIEALLARCGFKSNGLFVMDGSKRSSHGNAYFTGLGKNKRIVFFDTLLGRLSPPQIEAVLAHELGHFHHKHILKRMFSMFAGALGLLWLLGQLIDNPNFYSALGISQISTAMGLILFSLALPLATFPLNAIFSAISRKHEFEADAFAARHARKEDLIQALLKLYEDNASTLTPDPLYSLFHDSHPPAAIRISHLEQQT